MKNLQPIINIAEKIGIDEEDLITYDKYKAKISLNIINKIKNNRNGKLIVVTAITPTDDGEGKTTTSIGLAQGLASLNEKVMVALRQPSLGPVFGIKGGATGGGKCSVEPMEDINLHFTGDFHAINSAHNLLSAMVNSSLYFKTISIDPKKMFWHRAIDMNDRSLRSVVVGLGDENGLLIEDKFDILPASEIMAIAGLSLNYSDLKSRLSNILIGLNNKKEPVFAKDIRATGSMGALLKYAILPNLVQTTEHVPAFVHIGPFANLAYGTNSLIADNIGIKLADYLITETGFGSDMGFQKFMDMISRIGSLNVNLAVLVVSIKTLKHHGGVKKEAIHIENIEALVKGYDNLKKHLDIINCFGVPVVVSINKFKNDTNNELKVLMNLLEKDNIEYSINEGYEKGSEGSLDLAKKVIDKIKKENVSQFKYTYDINDDIEMKIDKITNKIYNAEGVIFSKKAIEDLRTIKSLGMDKLHVIIAKTPNSISDDPNKIGRPNNFKVTVNEIRIFSGGGFVVPVMGNILTMPGLGKTPAAFNIDIDDEGNITGIF
ncbi:MAG: formate--tetrahydrofolate ligase [Candidatus Thermoplasmatota archaeon]|jgi:formate--tetrahydrofolate ligase|nr:formate--tetrahydrofolate ligase [Candidatus Thermoplasmatota archaeon]MCL5962924.1 formate--tetrahydrofolate ligase [Candidatus Thermoplasmatota archaeon]